MYTQKITKITRYMILGWLVFLTACSPLVVVLQPTSQAPSPVASPTQEINPTETATTQQATQTPVPTLAVATATSVPPTATQVATAQPTATQAATAQPTATSAPATTGCQNAAKYISDDGLDGTTYAPNTPFTKTWTVKNTGTCTWDSRYLVAYISGTTMTQQPGYWIVQPGQTVDPGQTVNISIGMTSPVKNGSYRSYWGLKKEDGQLMPVQGGVNGKSFYVDLNVDDGSAGGKVTAASIDIELEQGSGAACTANATYFVHASITADGPTTASYEIMSTAGQIAAGYFEDNGLHPTVSGSEVFDRAGTKTVNLRFVGPYPYPADITVNLRVNGGTWHNTRLSCQ